MAELARTTAPAAEEPTRIVWEIALPDEEATAALGRLLAGELKAGDCLALSGGLGAGKTALARAIVRCLADDPGLDVPSPTFTLVQTYDTPAGAVMHADLYRIGGPSEIEELGFDDARDAVLLVEWPERAEAALPPDRLEVALAFAAPGAGSARKATLVGHGAFAQRLHRFRALSALLAASGWGEAQRALLHGDASSRAYERLVKPSGERAVLMISPPRPDGPPVRRGKPYSAIAKLAESVHAFVAMARGLRALDLSAPAILAEDLDAGLLILEDLGSEGVVADGAPVPERYAESARVLARLHGVKLPAILPVADGRDHALPAYDLEACLIEAELILDWYVPYVVRRVLPAAARAEFLDLWTEALEPILAAPLTWTLRDFHSPNLIWLPERRGVGQVGLLDFQDAVLGPPAYDVASLLQDARVTVPPDLELKLLGAYVQARQAAEAGFDFAAFAEAYAVFGAQRATKILGIFARLDKRDGKPHYLKHLPRIEAYLRRNLSHPKLAPVRGWYETHLPGLVPPPPAPEPSPEPAEASAEMPIPAAEAPAPAPPPAHG